MPMRLEDVGLKKEKENAVGKIIMDVALLQNLIKFVQRLLLNVVK